METKPPAVQHKPDVVQRTCVGLEFGILSASDIAALSVCDIHESKKRAQMNHVYDRRMGILSVRNNETCSTCGLTIKDCAGHFGSISLAVPILHPLFTEEIVYALKYICYRCHKCLVDDVSMPVSVYCPYCKCLQPSYRIHKDECGVERIRISNDEMTLTLSPSYILEIFKNADISQLKFKYNPVDLVLTRLPVLPITSRPSVFVNGNQCDDDLSYVYIEIVKLNKKIRKIASACLGISKTDFRLLSASEIERMVEMVRTKRVHLPGMKAGVDILMKLVGHLEMYIRTFMNNNHQLKYQNEKVIKCIKSRLNGKSGLMRGNVMGKRTDHCGRSVIGADAFIGVDEIVLPHSFITNLTIPENVNPLNINQMNTLIHKGKVRYIIRNGEQYTPRNFKLRVGDIVERCLRSGDYVILNRAPTLHTGSMVAMRVRILNDRVNAFDLCMKPLEFKEYIDNTDRGPKTIRFNLPICASLNADYDGDECNIHVPQTLPAMAELQELMSVRQNVIMSKGPLTILALSQDTILGLYTMTQHNRLIEYDTWCDIVYSAGADSNITDEEMESIRKNKKHTTYTLFSACLPKNFEYGTDIGDTSNMSQQDVEAHVRKPRITGGQLVRGSLTKSTMSNRPMSIPHVILKVYGNDTYVDFMTSVVLLTNRWLMYCSHSVGIGDCVIKDDSIVENKVSSSITSLMNDVSTSITVGRTPSVLINRSELADNRIYYILNNSKELGNDIIKNNLSANNNLKIMVDSGAKGNYVNICQIMALLGQQILNGKRVWPGYNTYRPLTYYISQDSSNIYISNTEKNTKPRIISNTSAITASTKRYCRDSMKTAYHNNTVFKYNKTQLRFPWTWESMDTINRDSAHPLQKMPALNMQHDVVAYTDSDNTFRRFVSTYFESGGFIISSFRRGLNPREFFFHAMGGRDGLLDTSCKTSVTGYLERRLTKVCEDIQVDYRYNVINTISGKLIQLNRDIDFFNTALLIDNRFILKQRILHTIMKQ